MRELFTSTSNIVIFSIIRNKLVFIPILESRVPVITYVDGFGNIKTNISFSNDFKKKEFLKVNVNNAVHLIKVSNTFSEVASGELLCYKGSNDTLEIAANLASAKNALKVRVGDHITIDQ